MNDATGFWTQDRGALFKKLALEGSEDNLIFRSFFRRRKSDLKPRPDQRKLSSNEAYQSA